MAGAALRGMGKVLAKHLRKAPVLGKRVRGTPTMAGLAARRAALRGETTAEKYRKLLDKTQAQPKTVKAPKIPSIKKTTKDIGKGAIIAGVAYAAGKSEAKKEAKAKEDKQKLKEALERQQKETKEKQKETKEKRKKYGKHHE